MQRSIPELEAAQLQPLVGPWGWWSLVGARSSRAMCIPLGQHLLLLLPDPKSYTEKILIWGGDLEGWMPECCFFSGSQHTTMLLSGAEGIEHLRSHLVRCRTQEGGNWDCCTAPAGGHS